MSILTGNEILKQVRKNNIYIKDFTTDRINPNSYNLRLDAASIRELPTDAELDCAKDSSKLFQPLSRDCIEFTDEQRTKIKRVRLLAGNLYLACTNELTSTKKYVPMLTGRSSLARLGVSVHQTAGFGDLGFNGRWTLEITCTNDTWLYEDMEIAQVYFLTPEGSIKDLYSGKYQRNRGMQTSRLYWEY